MPVDAQLKSDIEDFLYEEAALLDQRRFREWLDLWAADAHYFMPLRMTMASGQESEGWTQEHENSYFDDEKAILEMRVRQIETGVHWAEEPPSRTRHMVSNVRVQPAEQPGEYRVECNFIVYRNRMAMDEDWWVGRREDRLRRANGCWMIAERRIFLDQTTLRSKNLSNFF